MLGSQYILVAIDYATEWVETPTFYTDTTIIITKFIYKHTLTRFGCPLTIVIDQGAHFINDAIKYLTDRFILKHTSFIIYIHKEMDKLSLQIRFLEPYEPKWLMKIKIIGMNTCP